MAIKIRISFTFLSKKEEHIKKIIEAANYAVGKGSEDGDNFYDFLDFLKTESVFNGYIEDFDFVPEIEEDGFSCKINVEDIEKQFVTTSKYIMQFIDNIEKLFKKEIKVFFFSYSYDPNIFFCNDRDSLFYPWRGQVAAVIDSRDWYSSYCGEFYCDTEELISEVNNDFDLNLCNIKNNIVFKKLAKENNFSHTTKWLEEILRKKYPYSNTYFSIEEVQMV